MISPSNFKKQKPQYSNVRVRIADYEKLTTLRDKLNLNMIDLLAYLCELGTVTNQESTGNGL